MPLGHYTDLDPMSTASEVFLISTTEVCSLFIDLIVKLYNS